jgi:hypothetical protein
MELFMNFPKELLMDKETKGIVSTRKKGTTAITLGMAAIIAMSSITGCAPQNNEVKEITPPQEITLSGKTADKPFYTSKVACVDGQTHGLFDLSKVKDAEPYVIKGEQSLEQMLSFGDNYKFKQVMDTLCSNNYEGQQTFTFSYGSVNADLAMEFVQVATHEQGDKLLASSYDKFMVNKGYQKYSEDVAGALYADKDGIPVRNFGKIGELDSPIVQKSVINSFKSGMKGEVQNFINKNYGVEKPTEIVKNTSNKGKGLGI